MHAYLWLLAIYLLKANNKLSLFMPCHTHFHIIFGANIVLPIVHVYCGCISRLVIN